MIVCDIKNIKMVGKNDKYTKLGVLTKAYRSFQKEIYYLCKKVMIRPPYKVYITLGMYHDIDAPVQAILDVLQKKKIIEDDRYIDLLIIEKTPQQKGKMGSIKIEVGELV